MRTMRRLLMLVLVMGVVLALPGLAAAQEGGQTKHTVQAGENLTRIANQYGTTVTAIAQANNILNPNLIQVGQVLVIPTGTAAPTPTPTFSVVTPGVSTPVPPAATATPTPVPPPPGEIVHVVQPGENLFRIALKYNLATAVVASYNGITNANLIYVGQQIRIPASDTTAAVVQASATPVPVATTAPGATPAPAATSATTPVPTGPAPNTASNVGFAYGVEVHLPNQDMAVVLDSASALGVAWARQQIDWALYEPSQGAINWEPIDMMVDAMDEAGFKILLTVSAAPSWARDSTQEKGPPTDYQTYANFVGAMAARYEGRVDAYEIWSEQNLRREWNTPRGISAASYVEMLRLAYEAIKRADSSAIVVTGGLSPTGYNDGVNAIDDRVYLRQMYASGVADWSDAIGAQPYGWGNPPDSVCCRTNQPAVAGWDDHPSFFFKQTLEDYRAIMTQNGDSGTYIWVTEFGWGSNDGLGVELEATGPFGYVTYTTMDEQAQYILRGFQLGRDLGYVGPMVLYNLNFCQVVGVEGEQCLWGLLDPAGNPRPAYLALQDMMK